MRFEMFTEHEVELFAFPIIFFNLSEFFLSICMQHTDKKYQESGFWGHFLVLCTAGSLELPGVSPPGPPPRLCPGPTGWLIVPPRQPATPGNEIRSLHIVLSAGYHFHPLSSRQIWPTTINFLKKAWRQIMQTTRIITNLLCQSKTYTMTKIHADFQEKQSKTFKLFLAIC